MILCQSALNSPPPSPTPLYQRKSFTVSLGYGKHILLCLFAPLVEETLQKWG